MSNYKVQVQLYDDDGNFLGSADVQTIASLVYFDDGETFQQKLDNGLLKGATGAIGPQGPIGATGATGPRGDTGATGAQGATGAAGPQGIQGPSGAAGIRGSMIYYGTVLTGTSTTATIFSGSGITAALVNDLYINTSNWNVYQCMTAGAAAVAKWSYKGNIKGATGTQGPKGDTGATGAKGDTGAQGATGAQGPAGDSIKIGSTYATATEKNIFFKLL